MLTTMIACSGAGLRTSSPASVALVLTLALSLTSVTQVSAVCVHSLYVYLARAPHGALLRSNHRNATLLRSNHRNTQRNVVFGGRAGGITTVPARPREAPEALARREEWGCPNKSV